MKFETFRNNVYLLKLVWGSAKGLLTGRLIFAGLNSIRTVLTNVVLTKFIIDVIAKNQNINNIRLFFQFVVYRFHIYNG
jgi:hypothetical protein